MTDRAVLQLLRKNATHFRSVSAYAHDLGVPQQTLSAVLAETRPIGDALLKTLGYRRVIVKLSARRPSRTRR
jgi:hypothetical protein